MGTETWHARFHVLACVMLILVATLALACDEKTYSGTLSMRGHAPFEKLVLVADDGSMYELTGDKAKNLMSHQHNRIVLSGKKISEQKGPGFPAKLSVTSIISIGGK
jgi:hypothetical protein